MTKTTKMTALTSDVNLHQLRAQFEKAFADDTASPGSRPENPPPGAIITPSAGHCAAVSAILYAMHGGNMISAMVNGQSHWCNRMELDGETMDIDITGDQFAFPSIRTRNVGELMPNTRVREFSDLNKETLDRAIVLAKRAGLDAAADELQRRLTARPQQAKPA